MHIITRNHGKKTSVILWTLCICCCTGEYPMKILLYIYIKLVQNKLFCITYRSYNLGFYSHNLDLGQVHCQVDTQRFSALLLLPNIERLNPHQPLKNRIHKTDFDTINQYFSLQMKLEWNRWTWVFAFNCVAMSESVTVAYNCHTTSCSICFHWIHLRFIQLEIKLTCLCQSHT